MGGWSEHCRQVNEHFENLIRRGILEDDAGRSRMLPPNLFGGRRPRRSTLEERIARAKDLAARRLFSNEGSIFR